MASKAPAAHPVHLDEAGVVMVKSVVSRMAEITQLKQELADKTRATQDAIKDDVKALAERLNASPAQINSIVRLVQKSQADPTALEMQRSTIENVESVLGS
jgi:hypothetical protein